MLLRLRPVNQEREDSYTIVELNKIYILSAPKASEAMANDPDHFISSTSADQTYVEMGKIHSALMKDLTVTSIAKVFTHKGNTLQAVIHVTNLPIRMAEQRITQTVRKYAQNIVAQQTNKRRAISAQDEE